MNILFAVAVAVFAIAAFFFLSGYLAFAHTCKRNRLRDPMSYDKNKIPDAETVWITSADGLKLCASYFPCAQRSDKLMILFHGYRSCSHDEFSAIRPKLLENGFNLLAVDQRSHGRSEGKYIGFGALERQDCQKWCEYAAERFENAEIYLYGISMGASTILMAAGERLPSEVRAIVADCGFTTPWDIIKNSLKRKYRLPIYPLIFFMNFWSRVLAKFDFHSVSTVSSMKKNRLPVLFIHGKTDKVVPVDMSQKAFDASNDKCRILFFDDVRHAHAYDSFPDRYLYELMYFLNDK